ncbi:segregation/condensation protein A [Candidatus Micrarchaeota archaeon]|nr:segregation/condensation protein A [Candidatus Micrarchaeota archaeon]
MDLPLENIVQTPSWKQILLDMVHTQKINPWDVDIVGIADGFFERVKEMKKMNFYIPANIILACAILLKYKSEALLQKEEEEVLPEEEDLRIPFSQIEEIKPIRRIPPKRHITLKELMEEMEMVISYQPKKTKKPKRIEINLEISGFDLEDEVTKIWKVLEKEKDVEGWVLFSRITKGEPNERIVETLFTLLHMEQKQNINMKQDRFFEEIFIKMVKFNG